MEILKKVSASVIVLLLALMIAILFLDQPLNVTTGAFRTGGVYGRYASKDISGQMINYLYQSCLSQLQGNDTAQTRQFFLPYCIENRVKQSLAGADLAKHLGLEISPKQAKQLAIEEAKSNFEQQSANIAAEDRLSFSDWYRRSIQYASLDLRATQGSAANFFRHFTNEIPQTSSEHNMQLRIERSYISIDLIVLNRQTLTQKLTSQGFGSESRNKKIEDIFRDINTENKITSMTDLSKVTGLTITKHKKIKFSNLGSLSSNSGPINFFEKQLLPLIRYKNINKLQGPLQIAGITNDLASSNTLFFMIRSIYVDNSSQASDKDKRKTNLHNFFLTYIIDRQTKRGEFQLQLPDFN